MHVDDQIGRAIVGHDAPHHPARICMVSFEWVCLYIAHAYVVARMCIVEFMYLKTDTHLCSLSLSHITHAHTKIITHITCIHRHTCAHAKQRNMSGMQASHCCSQNPHTWCPCPSLSLECTRWLQTLHDVCVCMCMYVCVCIHILRFQTWDDFARHWVLSAMHIHAYKHTFRELHTWVASLNYICVCVSIYMCVCVYVCIYVCMYIYIYIYIYIYMLLTLHDGILEIIESCIVFFWHVFIKRSRGVWKCLAGSPRGTYFTCWNACEMYVYMYECMNACMCVYVCGTYFTCWNACEMYVCMYVCMHECMHVCVCV